MFFGHNLPTKGDSVRDLNGVPETFADQLIKFRIPYVMPGELVTDPNSTAVQFNEATFLHTIDKPFEVHMMHVELTGLDAEDNIPDLQPLSLDRLVRLRIEDTAKNEKISKSPTLVSIIRDALNHLWKWEVPYTFTRQEGFTIGVDTAALPTICVPSAEDCTSEPLVIAKVRTEISFQGYLVVLRPASDSR
jgi:hypothetical protein